MVHRTAKSGVRRALAMKSPSSFRFGPFEAQTYAQELSKNGTKIRLRGQPFSILELLLTRPGEVITREEIRQKLWPVETFVDFEHSLNTSIKKLRQALCDDWDWARSEQEFRRAIDLNPNYATAHQWYSYYLSATGRFPEAVEEARKAQQIDPLSLAINTTLSGRYRDLGQYAQAIDVNQHTLEMDHNFVPAHIALGSIYEGQGMWAQAISEYKMAVELSRNSPLALASLGHAYGISGNQKEARNILEKLWQASQRHYVSAFDMAVVFAGIGDRDSAFQWLEKAYADRESQMAFLGVTRRLDSLRSDHRFAELLHKMGLDVLRS
jgi:tetratricopeptide (TPR) repeat protein